MSIVKNLTFIAIIFFFASASSLFAQGGNSITGFVFGSQRQPVEGVTVELLDDFSRTLSRARTNSTGRYFFSGMSSGKYRVRILPLGTNYLEQQQEVEIQNMMRRDSTGRVIVSAFATIQQDFYLRSRKTDTTPSKAETIFIQNVPDRAKKLYDEALSLLETNQSKEGLKKLKNSIEIFPDYYMALERLGTEYIKLEYFEAAQILLQKAVEINPRSYNGWYRLGYTLYSLRLDAEALKAIQKAINLDSEATESLLLAGTLLRQTGKYKESEKQLLAAQKSAEVPVPNIHWQLALLYGNHLNRYKDAAEELELFLKAAPNSKDTEKIKALIKVFRDKSKSE